jgi:hypothetical protein
MLLIRKIEGQFTITTARHVAKAANPAALASLCTYHRAYQMHPAIERKLTSGLSPYQCLVEFALISGDKFRTSINTLFTKLKLSRRSRQYAFGVGAVALYLLSVGPSELLCQRGLVPEYVLRIVYFPFLAVNDTPLERPVGWYCELWTGRAMPACPDELESAQK